MQAVVVAAVTAFIAGAGVAGGIVWGWKADTIAALEAEKEAANNLAKEAKELSDEEIKSASEVAEAAKREVERFISRPPKTVFSERIIRVPVSRMCQSQIDLPGTQKGAGEPQPAGETDSTDALPPGGYIPSDQYRSVKGALMARLEKYEAGHHAHEQLSRVVQALPCVRLVD